MEVWDIYVGKCAGTDRCLWHVRRRNHANAAFFGTFYGPFECMAVGAVMLEVMFSSSAFFIFKFFFFFCFPAYFCTLLSPVSVLFDIHSFICVLCAVLKYHKHTK